MTARERNFKRANRHRMILDRYKRMKGCIDCGFKGHPAALEFDHIDPATKGKTVAAMMYNGWETIKQEVAKCEIRCANCHQVKSVLDRRSVYAIARAGVVEQQTH